jgi:hypothetical protein
MSLLRGREKRWRQLVESQGREKGQRQGENQNFHERDVK